MSLSAVIAILVLLFLLNGLFAMSELAVVSARRVRLRQLAEDGHKGAALALGMAEDPASFLSTVQTGMTLISVLAGAYSGATIAGHFADYLNQISWIAPDGGAWALGITVAGVTYFNLVVGELIPKRIGLSYAEPIAIRAAYLMRFLAVTFAPVVWFLRQSTSLALRILHLTNPRDMSVTEDEVRDLIAEGAQSGVFKPEEKEMLEGVMRLADRTVRSIMTPRVEMAWLNIEDELKDNHATIGASGYSRFPVARGDLEEILGFVHAKDMLNAALNAQITGAQPSPLRSVMRSALTVPDTTTVLRLLEQFRRSRQHIAIVVDEYGSVEGLVSTSDILQAIIGDLPERGRDYNAAPQQRPDGSWLLDAMAPLDEVENLIGLKAMRGEGDFHTLAGFVVDRLGRLPVAGDHFQWEDTRFEVVKMDARRVDQVLVVPPQEESAEEAGG